ncbi:hypothetical protein [Methylomagnum ishizawai]|uniref:hypothetical protein n=1 Tax=Methylomagnum ishizawai TaxID=1760988 RepID=UPI001C324065|nr:hypothetical protein [Methylomagnum ishizawai]BBL75577.1 hypothetical protein MishRS11D_26750 [Methylomagnum ishizawai]
MDDTDDMDDFERENRTEEPPATPVPAPIVEEPAATETVEADPAWNTDASPGRGGSYELDPATGIRRLIQPAHAAA